MTISELEQQLAGMELKLDIGDDHYYFVDDPGSRRYDHRYASARNQETQASI